MDLLKEIREKIKSSAGSIGAAGLDSVLAHIEIAERHYLRAKTDRDEPLYTDVIYRTNHAYEGILKEAYVLLADKPSAKMTPNDIESYLLSSDTLKGRVVDLLKNYRQQWRNPSTHDHQLFFSEQEAFLAIVSVSAFVSILLDQILERAAYNKKFDDLNDAAVLARDRIKDFEKRSPISKAETILQSYASHYVRNFSEMSAYSRATANAQMAAFIKKVAPELDVGFDVQKSIQGKSLRFDLILTDGGEEVAIETRGPKPRDHNEAWFEEEALVAEFSKRMIFSHISNGILFFYPGHDDDIIIITTGSSAWPRNLNLREVYGADPSSFQDEALETPISLIDEEA